MTDWNQSLNFGTSPEVTKAWKEFFLGFNEIIAIFDGQNNQDIQKEKFDAVIVFKEFFPQSVTVEIKTGSSNTYHKYYIRQKGIVFEDISNIERKTYTSCIWDCNAYFYVYGFFINGKIKNATIFKTEKINEWLHDNYSKIPKFKTSTNNLYHTQFMLPCLDDIPDECIWKGNKYSVKKISYRKQNV